MEEEGGIVDKRWRCFMGAISGGGTGESGVVGVVIEFRGEYVGVPGGGRESGTGGGWMGGCGVVSKTGAWSEPRRVGLEGGEVGPGFCSMSPQDRISPLPKMGGPVDGGRGGSGFQTKGRMGAMWVREESRMRAGSGVGGERRGEWRGRLEGGDKEEREEGRGCLPVMKTVDGSEFAGGGAGEDERGSS